MKRKLTLAIIVSIITLSFAACSEGQPISLNSNINDFNNADEKYNKIMYNSFEVKLLNDVHSLHPILQYVIEQAKTQKGYLTFKGSDFSYSDITLIFISSGEKNTGGYDIEIETIQKENDEINVVVKETTPNAEDIVTQAITYPFVLFTMEGEYDSFRITDLDGNQFDPINLKDLDIESAVLENNDLSDVNIINKEVINKIKADALVEKFIDALNLEDSRKILDCLDPEMVGYYTTETVEATISDYKVYFENSPIIKYNWVASNSDTPNLYTYELISQSGSKLDINVIYNEDAMWIDCALLNYSYQSKHLLERFIYALKKESKVLLSQVLTVNDVDYPVSNAFKIIEKYKEHFNLESLEYQFIGINSEDGTFTYHIIGEKNGIPVEHAIKIIYENRLVHLSDPWTPPY